MAEAFLQILLENINSLIKTEIGLIMEAEDEMKELYSTLTTIQAVLEDAEDKQLKDVAIRNWLRKLKDLSYEIDDILDECATEMAKLEYQSRKSKFVGLKKILYKRKVGRRIKEATKKLGAVAAEREKFHLKETTIVVRNEVHNTRETGSVLNETHRVFGREDEKEKIVDMLVNQVKDQEQLSILPIVGVGGLGKTTFAQLVLNDKRVIEHFDVTLWVCVSDNFDQKTLIRAMIESASRSGSASNLEHLDSLQHSLLRELNQKRYLLVMDDVWNESQDKWFDLRNLLGCGSNGSSIIVTTRLKKVADIMSTFPPLYLKGLSEEDCWLLFKERAFGPGQEENKKLEAIGKLIVKKCAGVPLAAKALGGLLRFKRKEDDWRHVKESELWDLPQEESTILPVLRLSYRHLPFELRHCFTYCSIFPKDTQIDKKELILHWIAHGYISTNGELEDIGDGICNELVLRSLFQNVQTRNGKSAFQLHDLVHDLAQSIMDNRIPGKQDDLDNMRISNNKIRQVDLLRKFIAFPMNVLSEMVLTSTIARFSHLRILDASDTDIHEVPSAIGSLKRLRYLNFSRTRIRNLPDALCDLWNLKILNLNECRSLKRLPKSMRRLRNLHHLFLSWGALVEMPSKIGELTSLKTLNMFIVSRGKYNQLGELQYLDLGGELCIDHLERVEDVVEASKANLREKKNLRKLSLMWENDDSCKLRGDMDEKVLGALEPHANIKYLYVSDFQGKNFPFWMGNSSTLENLTVLLISGCPNCLYLPQVIGELPCLESLDLTDLTVEYIIENEICGSNLMKPKFPRLKTLGLYGLPHLKGLLKEDEAIMFPALEIFHVHRCGSLKLPHLPSLKTINCESKSLTSFTKLDNLTFLTISFGESLNSVPKEALENLLLLKSLRIAEASEDYLPEEGFHGLKSLELLIITSCNTLTCLPEKWLSHLTALRSLHLDNCHELVDFPEGIKNLHNLKDVTLRGLKKMVCLLNALQHLTSLQSLELISLHELTILPDWFGNFSSLDSLFIEHCQKLASFPSSIQQMVKLRSLHVINCPNLWKRCEKGKGEDWHKISHIPYVLGRL